MPRTNQRIEKVIPKGKGKRKVQFKNWPSNFDTEMTKKELNAY